MDRRQVQWRLDHPVGLDAPVTAVEVNVHCRQNQHERRPNARYSKLMFGVLDVDDIIPSRGQDNIENL